jgi:hypothetical protein
MSAAASIQVTALSEWPDQPPGPRVQAIIVSVPSFASLPPIIVGVISRDQAGWYATVRIGWIRRRFAYTTHPSAYGAVAAIIGSRIGRRLGCRPWSTVTWSDAAATAASDASGAGVTA